MRKKQLERVMNMLKNDRNVTADNFINLFKIDLSKLLADYFVNPEGVQVNLEKNGNGVNGIITFCAVEIKPFTSVPEVNLL